MLRMINKRFWEHPGHFFLQSLLIIAFMFLTLLPLGSLEASIFTAIGASTVASSILTMFALPKSPVAAIHRVIGGYIIGILIGMLLHAFLFWLQHHFQFARIPTVDICAAIAVGIAMIIMALLDFIHPPAAGLALAIVIGPWNHWTIMIIAISVVAMCVIKWLLRNWFINLL